MQRRSLTAKRTVCSTEFLFSAIAQHVSEAAPAEKAILIDCFAGVGGNVIAFALSDRWKRVYAIEKNPAAIACAKHNAQIYGVQDKISWYAGDCFDILRNELAGLGEHSIVFASPPWGGMMLEQMNAHVRILIIAGPGYRSDAVFNLAKMQPYSLTDLLDLFHQVTRDVAIYLPRTSDVRQLASQMKQDKKITVMHYCMEGASKVGYLPFLLLAYLDTI